MAPPNILPAVQRPTAPQLDLDGLRSDERPAHLSSMKQMEAALRVLMPDHTRLSGPLSAPARAAAYHAVASPTAKANPLPSINASLKTAVGSATPSPAAAIGGEAPSARAQFATASRLLCCLVNEGMAAAVLIDDLKINSVSNTPPAGWACLVSPNAGLTGVADALHGRPAAQVAPPPLMDVSAIVVPLRLRPMLRSSDSASGTLQRIRGLDPDDLMRDHPFMVFSGEHAPLYETLDPCFTWDVVATWNDVDVASATRIRRELLSSVLVQDHLFRRNVAVTAPTLSSSAMAWEQAILEGHATHPMHRTRSAAEPVSFDVARGDLERLENSALSFFAVPRARVQAHGTWLAEVHPHLMAYLGLTDADVPADHVLFPVHDFQVPWVRAKFPEFALVARSAVRTAAQASTRTVVPQDPAFAMGAHVKTSICMTVTSAMRTISPFTIQNGPTMSRMAHLVNRGRKVLYPIDEYATVGLEHPDELMAKSMGCILRVNPERQLPGESVIVAASLVERGSDGVPHVVRAFGLDSRERRVEFLRRYVHLLLEAVIPPLVEFGFAFEAHGQNMLLRVRKEIGAAASSFSVDRLAGFAVRDYGGALFHRESWVSAAQAHGFSPADCALPDAIRPGSFQLAASRAAAHKVLYHTAFACHLHRLIRALDLHAEAGHPGAGWAIVRESLHRLVPRDSDLWHSWMAARDVPAKAFVRMKCGGLYRDYVYERVPNLLLTGLADAEISELVGSDLEDSE